LYNAELIFGVDGEVEKISYSFVYLPFIDVYGLFIEVWGLNGIKVYRLNVKYASELKLDEHYSPPRRLREYHSKFDLSLFLFPLI